MKLKMKNMLILQLLFAIKWACAQDVFFEEIQIVGNQTSSSVVLPIIVIKFLAFNKKIQILRIFYRKIQI